MKNAIHTFLPYFLLIPFNIILPSTPISSERSPPQNKQHVLKLLQLLPTFSSLSVSHVRAVPDQFIMTAVRITSLWLQSTHGAVKPLCSITDATGSEKSEKYITVPINMPF
jgi:hypothetical protein